MRTALRFVTPADKSLSIICFPLSFSVAPFRFAKDRRQILKKRRSTALLRRRSPIERAIAIAIRTTQVHRDASQRGNVVKPRRFDGCILRAGWDTPYAPPSSRKRILAEDGRPSLREFVLTTVLTVVYGAYVLAREARARCVVNTLWSKCAIPTRGTYSLKLANAWIDLLYDRENRQDLLLVIVQENYISSSSFACYIYSILFCASTISLRHILANTKPASAAAGFSCVADDWTIRWRNPWEKTLLPRGCEEGFLLLPRKHVSQRSSQRANRLRALKIVSHARR